MKTPIKPEDIRKGDAIRYEPDVPGVVIAQEYRAVRDGHSYLPQALGGQHYLLDRPAPKVELPETPTLGWGTWSGGPYLAVWQSNGAKLLAVDDHGERDGDAGYIESFTEAVAVPKAALDELREAAWPQPYPPTHHYRTALRTFLAAVDEANRADR